MSDCMKSVPLLGCLYYWNAHDDTSKQHMVKVSFVNFRKLYVSLVQFDSDLYKTQHRMAIRSEVGRV